MQNAENITIENCLFDHVGGNGVFMSAYNDHNVVSNCDFEGTGANCVCLFGLRSSIRCPNSWTMAISQAELFRCNAGSAHPGLSEHTAWSIIT